MAWHSIGLHCITAHIHTLHYIHKTNRISWSTAAGALASQRITVCRCRGTRTSIRRRQHSICRCWRSLLGITLRSQPREMGREGREGGGGRWEEGREIKGGSERGRKGEGGRGGEGRERASEVARERADEDSCRSDIPVVYLHIRTPLLQPRAATHD